MAGNRTRAKGPLIHVDFRIDPEDWETVKQLAVIHKVSISEITRTLVTWGLEQAKQ